MAMKQPISACMMSSGVRFFSVLRTTLGVRQLSGVMVVLKILICTQWIAVAMGSRLLHMAWLGGFKVNR